MERVQSEGNELYVSKRNILQPAAQQVERVQIVEGEYGKNVLERRLLQPAAPRSLVRGPALGRAVRIGMTGSTFFGLVIWRFAI